MYFCPPRSNRARLVWSLTWIKRVPLFTSLTAIGNRHSGSSCCLKTCVISWLWGSAITQGWDPSTHTSSQGLYMSMVHSSDHRQSLTHLAWSTPDMLLSQVYESCKQWKPFNGNWVYCKLSKMKKKFSEAASCSEITFCWNTMLRYIHWSFKRIHSTKYTTQISIRKIFIHWCDYLHGSLNSCNVIIFIIFLFVSSSYH